MILLKHTFIPANTCHVWTFLQLRAIRVVRKLQV